MSLKASLFIFGDDYYEEMQKAKRKGKSENTTLFFQKDDHRHVLHFHFYSSHHIATHLAWFPGKLFVSDPILGQFTCNSIYFEVLKLTIGQTFNIIRVFGWWDESQTYEFERKNFLIAVTFSHDQRLGGTMLN